MKHLRGAGVQRGNVEVDKGDIKDGKKFWIILGELKSLFTFAAAKNGRVH
jgi:hypothetical protein